MKRITACCAQFLEQAMRKTPADVMEKLPPVMIQIIVQFVNLPTRRLSLLQLSSRLLRQFRLAKQSASRQTFRPFGHFAILTSRAVLRTPDIQLAQVSRNAGLSARIVSIDQHFK